MDPAQILNQVLAAAGLAPTTLPAQVDLSLGNILRAILILVIVYVLARFLRQFFTRALARTPFDPRVKTLLLQVVFYGVIALGVIWVLGGFGLSIVVLGIAAGFALKDLIQNFAAGLLIMGTRPFHPGDWVLIGANEGRVVEVGWRGTFIDGFDGRRFIVPNSSIITSVVVNNSLRPQLRSVLNVGIDLGSDFEQAQKMILKALAGVPGIAAEPPPSVLIDSISGNALNLVIYIWVTDPVNQQKRVVSAALRALNEALRSNGLYLNPAAVGTPANLKV